MSGHGGHLILSVLCEEVVHTVEDVFCPVGLRRSSVQTADLGWLGKNTGRALWSLKLPLEDKGHRMRRDDGRVRNLKFL